MNRSRGDARAWLAWALAGGLVATAWRNPVVLLPLLLVVLVVGLRLAPASTISRGWRRAGRLAPWLVTASVVMNLLTVRAGDVVMARLPDAWPGLGGALTLNALVAGLVAGLGLLVILAIWAVFNSVVSQGDLLRLTPRPLSLAGAVGSIALTFLPGMARAAAQIGEAQAVRGHRARGVRDLPPLAVPLLSLALERGLSLAEAMEARGFGATLAATGTGPPATPLTIPDAAQGAGSNASRPSDAPRQADDSPLSVGARFIAPFHPAAAAGRKGAINRAPTIENRAAAASPGAAPDAADPAPRAAPGAQVAGVAAGWARPWRLPLGSAALTAGLLLLATPWPAVGLALAGIGLPMTWGALSAAGPRRTRYRRRRWERGNTIVTACAALAVLALAAARLGDGASLVYGAYPTLQPPPVSFWGLAAAALLLAPALCAEAGWR